MSWNELHIYVIHRCCAVAKLFVKFISLYHAIHCYKQLQYHPHSQDNLISSWFSTVLLQGVVMYKKFYRGHIKT